jgi:hypothetical protein
MTYAPELRSIPLTFLDCEDRGPELDNMPWYYWHECGNVGRFYPGCEINRQLGRCPRGYPS